MSARTGKLVARPLATRHDSQSLSDEELLQAVLARDEPAWREFVRRFTQPLRDAIQAATDETLSEQEHGDVIGEFWLRLLERDMARLRAFNPSRGTPLTTWLGLRVSQVAYEHARRAGDAAQTVASCDVDDLPDLRPPPTVDVRQRTGRMLRVDEVAKRWDLNVKTVYGMIERGELPARRCGRVLRVPKHVIESIEQGRVVSPRR